MDRLRLTVQSRERSMPTETVIVITAVTAAFVLFAVVVAWVDLRSRDLPR